MEPKPITPEPGKNPAQPYVKPTLTKHEPLLDVTAGLQSAAYSASLHLLLIS